MTTYNQYCPVAMAAEIVCTRWTMLVLRELLEGCTRFNELQRGLPRMSSALLSKRLKDPGATAYRLTRAGEDLGPVVQALGVWGLRWADPEMSLQRLDPNLLMWNVKRKLDPTPRPPRRCTIEFTYPDVAARNRRFWLIVTVRDVDLCRTDPGFGADVYVSGDLRSVTSLWMGLSTPQEEIDSGRVEISGTSDLVRLVKRWLAQSPGAKARKQLAA